MKPSTVCFLTITFTLFCLIIVLFFRDRVLFFLMGYNYEMTKTVTVESCKAHEAIQKWRLILFGLTLLLGITSIVTCTRMEKAATGGWYYTTGKLLGIITTILMIFIFIMFIIIPKRLV
jgi:uncharacterized membrane protein YidH (DUF202 family)